MKLITINNNINGDVDIIIDNKRCVEELVLVVFNIRSVNFINIMKILIINIIYPAVTDPNDILPVVIKCIINAKQAVNKLASKHELYICENILVLYNAYTKFFVCVCKITCFSSSISVCIFFILHIIIGINSI